VKAFVIKIQRSDVWCAFDATVVRFQVKRFVASLQRVKAILGANSSPPVSIVKSSYNTLDTWRRKFPFRASGRQPDYTCILTLHKLSEGTRLLRLTDRQTDSRRIKLTCHLNLPSLHGYYTLIITNTQSPCLTHYLCSLKNGHKEKIIYP